jgi:hypothetical protein
VKPRFRLSPPVFAALVWLAALGCQRTPPDRPPESGLPPAYASRHFNDPELGKIAEEICQQALQKTAPSGQPLYSRAEVLPPAPTVQPYGVGVYQQEVRLPVILTTGAGWSLLKTEEKEKTAAQAFRDLSERLRSIQHDPQLRPTLTIQTPEGMELAWINHLDPNGKNLHGDE